MTEQAPHERKEDWIINLVSAGGYLVELASILVQVILVVNAIDIYARPGGESRAFAKMGLLILISASFYLVIPATVIALGRTAGALARFRARAGLLPLAIHALAALLPFISYPIMFDDRPASPREDSPAIARKQTPDPSEWLKTQGGSRTSGATWAMDNLIVREEDCSRGRPPRAFIEGCKAQARWQANRAPERRQ